jgi:hypothetical protein
MVPNVTRKAKLVVGVSILFVALIPIRTVSAPDWNVCVVDASNRPVSGALVREAYQNYSAEFSSHDQDLYTDAKGCVHFSTKKVTSPLFMRMLAILYAAAAGVHASFGPNSYVIAFEGTLTGEDVRSGYIYTWTGAPQQEASTLKLHE